MMMNRLKAAYTQYSMVKVAAFVGVVLGGVLLFALSGGFPPLAWRLLIQALMQLPRLWAMQGAGVLIPLFGLVLLSTSLLIIWMILAVLAVNIVLHWWHDFHEHQHFAMDLREAQQMVEQQFAEQFMQPASAETILPRQSPQIQRQSQQAQRPRQSRQPQQSLAPTKPVPVAHPDELATTPQMQAYATTRHARAVGGGRTSSLPDSEAAPTYPPRRISYQPAPRRVRIPDPQSNDWQNGNGAPDIRYRPTAPLAGRPRLQIVPTLEDYLEDIDDAVHNLGNREDTDDIRDVRNIRGIRDIGDSEYAVSTGDTRDIAYPENNAAPVASSIPVDLDTIETPVISEIADAPYKFSVPDTAFAPVATEVAYEVEVASGTSIPDIFDLPDGLDIPDTPDSLDNLPLVALARPEVDEQAMDNGRRTTVQVSDGKDEDEVDLSLQNTRREYDNSYDTLPFTEPLMPQEPLRLIVGLGLDPGIVRKHAPNEDNIFAIQGTRVGKSGATPVGLFIVADGMGGHANGQEASRLAIQALSDVIVPSLLHNMRALSSPNNEHINEDTYFRDLLKDGVHRANLAIYRRNRDLPRSMGTTVTAALVVNKTAYIVNVGDSRTYIYHAPDGLKQITRDHSIVARLVEDGVITREGIYTHPRRNQIYRALGNSASIEVDCFTVPLQTDDVLLLCSDGLWEMVRDNDLQQIITSSLRHPSQISSMLVQAALSRGGADNIGVVVVGITQTPVL